MKTDKLYCLINVLLVGADDTGSVQNHTNSPYTLPTSQCIHTNALAMHMHTQVLRRRIDDDDDDDDDDDGDNFQIRI